MQTDKCNVCTHTHTHTHTFITPPDIHKEDAATSYLCTDASHHIVSHPERLLNGLTTNQQTKVSQH